MSDRTDSTPDDELDDTRDYPAPEPREPSFVTLLEEAQAASAGLRRSLSQIEARLASMARSAS